ncbi:MAG TPA: hypothetical protein DCP97_05525 [Ruminococcaceae bacterium]|nr:hypothetical protein [Oscillospiraceae bacterium]
MKMQVLYFSKDGNSQILANALSREHRCKCDQIPPAYPCENEKLVIIGLELNGKEAPKQVVDFCKNMTDKRAKNVAFFEVSSNGGIDGLGNLKSILKGNGINVMDDVHICTVKGSLFSKGKVTEGDVVAIKDWSIKLIEKLSQ